MARHWLLPYSKVIFQVELVKGKDPPPEEGPQEYNKLGKTVGLLLCLIKGMWGSGKIVVLDSGFCVIKCLVELTKRGVYAAFIKKRRYDQGTFVEMRFKATLHLCVCVIVMPGAGSWMG
mmetsp:Transcript_1932/g.2699  ORF Transcript_1932/g.2699 Transcript_1932/m.2699 type:complete len:119 (-) Transcript_1932:341-697(-)